jgi:UDPglucose 6-dehydrogenase
VVSFLKSGCGFGGSCFPKDLAALAAFGASQGVPMAITSAVLEVNRAQPARLVSLLGDVRGKRVAVLGVSFKPGTDDIRESPAIDIISLLFARGAEVVAFDPVAVAPDVPHASTLDEALAGADAVVLVTAWPQFAAVPEMLAGRSIPVADGRRMFSPEALLDYRAIGRA